MIYDYMGRHSSLMYVFDCFAHILLIEILLELTRLACFLGPVRSGIYLMRMKAV